MISLESYPLNGWVTEHVRIMQDLSQLYRHLKAWETDPKRAVSMLNRRAVMLSPLVDQLSAQVYQHLVRNLSFEVSP